jgi:alpha-L-fucosidase
MRRHILLNLISCAVLSAAAILTRAAAPAPGNATATAAPGARGRGNQSRFVSPETKEQKDARMKWWREARFGMFIHWGIYSVPAGVYQGRNISNLGEWIMNYAKIPSAEYKKYADQFNPTKFNADDFVTLAKSAGQKYMIITSKHHDGFAMFKSADPFNVVDATPFKRDVIRELSDACKKQGIHFGVYYSQMQDWNHPGGDVQGNNPNGHWDPTMKGSLDDYLQKVSIPQVKELFANIKPEVLWWDTQGRITPEQAKPLHDLLDTVPGIITNNRLANYYPGDTETPEGTIPATGYPGGRDWETCMTINNTWGYKSTDNNYKSTETLIRNLCDIASKGGNYLLNVGPTAEGIIPQPQVDRLLAMGKWLQVNGDAIYATGPNPFVRVAAPAPAPAPDAAPATGGGGRGRGGRGPAIPWDWRATTKLNSDGSGKIYLHIFQWPADGNFTMKYTGYKGTITKAYLLANPATTVQAGVNADGDPTTLTLKLPTSAPDPVASVVCLEVKP